MEVSTSNAKEEEPCELYLIGVLRGGAEGATAPPFFLVFLKCFETSALLYCFMS